MGHVLMVAGFYLTSSWRVPCRRSRAISTMPSPSTTRPGELNGMEFDELKL